VEVDRGNCRRAVVHVIGPFRRQRDLLYAAPSTVSLFPRRRRHLGPLRQGPSDPWPLLTWPFIRATGLVIATHAAASTSPKSRRCKKDAQGPRAPVPFVRGQAGHAVLFYRRDGATAWARTTWPPIRVRRDVVYWLKDKASEVACPCAMPAARALHGRWKAGRRGCLSAMVVAPRTQNATTAVTAGRVPGPLTVGAQTQLRTIKGRSGVKKNLNHEIHERHEKKTVFIFVSFVSFV